MYLRNGLLIISILMIGFCLSLYFQTEPAPGSFNWDQYKGLSYNEERSHSLNDLNEKTAPIKIEDLISEVYEKNHMAGEKTRVMEIGIGNGRVLMGLKKLFPEVEFYGINREKTHTFYRRESFILTALKFEIMSKPELENIDLPYVVFTDVDYGNRIPYADDKFDIVFSQDTMRYIKYKFEVWNEILRILKPGGISLHTDVSNINIYAQGVVMGTREAFQEIKKRGIDISLLENPHTVIFKKKYPDKKIFPVTPHHPIPENIDTQSEEQKRPEMGYNLSY